MSKQEVISLIKRNRYSKSKAIALIADFLDISRNKAETFYEIEILRLNEVEQ